MIDPNRAVDLIADGGTRGLIWALCAAILALAACLAWIGRRHIIALDAHRTELSALHKAHADSLHALVRETTQALTSVTGSVEDIVEGVGALEDASRVLQALAAGELARTTTRKGAR